MNKRLLYEIMKINKKLIIEIIGDLPPMKVLACDGRYSVDIKMVMTRAAE